MSIVELNGIPLEDLPLEAFSSHLRLAEGFGEIPGQGTRLEGCLRSSIAALEARLGKAFFQRAFMQTHQSWTDHDRFPLGMAPVISVDSLKIVSGDGTEKPLDPSLYRLVNDPHRPRIAARRGYLPMLSEDDHAEIIFTAGFAEDWEGVPAALQQATLLLAESYFEGSSDQTSLPCTVCLLVEPFRDIRLRGGRG